MLQRLGSPFMRAQNAYDQVMETLRGMNAFADANAWERGSNQISEAFSIADREFATNSSGAARCGIASER